MNNQIKQNRLGRLWTAGWPYLLIGTFSLILLAALVGHRAFSGGVDTYFHMNAFYEAARQIRTGHFSYFLSVFGFNQSGRIVNALYGPVFDYLGGGLLLICGSWVRFEIVLFWLTLTIGGAGMYLAARQARVRKPIALGVAILYLTSRPVVTSWLGNSEFTGLGTLLLPYVLGAGVRIVRQRRIRWVPLAIVMAICLQVHVMTSLIATLALLPFFLTGLATTHQKARMLGDGGLALILAWLLSGNVTGAIYDVFTSNHLIPNFPCFNLQSTRLDTAVSFQHRSFTVMGGTYTLILVLTILVCLVGYRFVNRLDWDLLLDSCLFLWLASIYFPWNRLGHLFPRFYSLIQFPQRFVPVVFATSLLLFGRLLTRLTTVGRWPIRLGALLVLLAAFVMPFRSAMSYTQWLARVWYRPGVVRYNNSEAFTRTHNGGRIRQALRSHDLKRGISVIDKFSPDYMPTPHRFDVNRYYTCPIFKEAKDEFMLNRRHFAHRLVNHGIELTWRMPPSRSNKRFIRVPLVSYGRTTVRFNCRALQPRQTMLGTMILPARPGVNHLWIRYQPGVVFKLMSTAAVFSWGILIIDAGWRDFRKEERR